MIKWSRYLFLQICLGSVHSSGQRRHPWHDLFASLRQAAWKVYPYPFYINVFYMKYKKGNHFSLQLYVIQCIWFLLHFQVFDFTTTFPFLLVHLWMVMKRWIWESIALDLMEMSGCRKRKSHNGYGNKEQVNCIQIYVNLTQNGFNRRLTTNYIPETPQKLPQGLNQ